MKITRPHWLSWRPALNAGGFRMDMLTIGSLRTTWRRIQSLLSTDDPHRMLTSDWRLMALVASGWAITLGALLVAVSMWGYGTSLSASAISAKVTTPAMISSVDLGEPQIAEVTAALTHACSEIDVKTESRGVSLKAHDNSTPQFLAWESCLRRLPAVKPNWRFRVVEMTLGEETHQPPSAIIGGAVITIGH